MKRKIITLFLITVMGISPITNFNIHRDVNYDRDVNYVRNENRTVASKFLKTYTPTIVNKLIHEASVKMKRASEIQDKKEWFIAYKSIVSEYANVLDPPETIYDYFNQTELDLFFRVVQAEVGDEYDFLQKCNVASVILNRLYDNEKNFGTKIKEVLIPSQFQTIRNGRYKEVVVSEDTILACEYAFAIEDTTGGCRFFDSNNTLDYKFSFNDEAHNFYK